MCKVQYFIAKKYGVEEAYRSLGNVLFTKANEYSKECVIRQFMLMESNHFVRERHDRGNEIKSAILVTTYFRPVFDL